MARSEPTSTDWLQAAPEQQGLKRYLDTLRERIWLIVAAVVITTGVALIYVATAAKVYEGEADVLVAPVSDETGTLAGLGLISESNDPVRAVETAAALIRSVAAAELAAQDLDLDADPDQILERISVAPVAESNLVTVTAEAPTAGEAADLADAFAAGAIEHRSDVLRDRVDETLPTLRDRLDATAPGLTRDTLAAQVAEYETLRAGGDPTLALEEPATEPNAPVSPRTRATVAAGILAGLVLGIGGAFALQVLDPRLRREAQLRERFRLPTLARIPREPGRGVDPLGWDSLSPASVEAYRALRAMLARPLAREGRSGSVLVTSAGPSEGKTTTAINLATALAFAGQSVILIEADLRRPSIGRTLGVEPERGVISVLIEEAALEESLVASPGEDNLSLLIAERAGAWGSELLSLPAAQRLVDDAKRLADFVVVDSPPLATVVDALPMTRTVDDVLLVARLGKSRLSSIQELAELLADSGITPAGFAVIGVPRPRDAYYGDHRRRLTVERPEPVSARRE